MKFATLSLTGLLVLQIALLPAWGLRSGIDPKYVALNCPVIVLGKIEKVDKSAPEMEHDLVSIRIERVLVNELSDVKADVGELIQARMISTNRKVSLSTDFSFTLGQRGVWMLMLKPDGQFYLDEYPEQFQAAGDLRKLELEGIFERSIEVTLTKEGRGAGITKAEYLALPEERRKEREKNREKRAARLAATLSLAQSLLQADGNVDKKKIESVLNEIEHDERILLVQNKSETLKLTAEQHTEIAGYFLEKDSSYYIRMNAAQWITHRGNPLQIRQTLLAALSDESYGVRRSICRALAEIEGDEEVMLALRKCLSDSDVRVRLEAVRSLAKIGDKDSLPLIAEMFKSTEFDEEQNSRFAGAVLELGDEELWLAAAHVGLGSDAEISRENLIRNAKLVKSEKLVPLLMRYLAKELERAKQRPNRDRVFEGMCAELERRTGESFGNDVLKWVAWWNEHCEEYHGEEVEIDEKAVEESLRQYRADKAVLRK